MAIPKVDPEAIERAIQDFDKSVRISPEWMSWEENKAQVEV